MSPHIRRWPGWYGPGRWFLTSHLGHHCRHTNSDPATVASHRSRPCHHNEVSGDGRYGGMGISTTSTITKAGTGTRASAGTGTGTNGQKGTSSLGVTPQCGKTSSSLAALSTSGLLSLTTTQLTGVVALAVMAGALVGGLVVMVVRRRARPYWNG